MDTGSSVKIQEASPKRRESESSLSEPEPSGPSMFPDVPDSEDEDECPGEQHSKDRGDGGASTSTSGTLVQHSDSTGLMQVQDPSTRPKWWHNTVGDIRPGELVDGRSTRSKSKKPDMVNYALMATIQGLFEPQTFQEASGRPAWDRAMQVEYDTLMRNNTWDLVVLPSGKKPIACIWVYKVKYKADGTLDKYKARLVVKGFSQVEGIDYEETFAPTANMSTIHLILAMATQFGWKVQQMDVMSAFLNGELEEEVYMCQPQGFWIPGR
eukprot:Gb_10175 [translate_table: standard]